MKIICVGRNYAKHAAELKNEIPTEPVLFMKAKNAVLPGNQDFYYPSFTQNLHYECELVLRICKNGKHIQPKFASKYYDQITVGIDFTARDIQDKQKAKGLPWEIAKAFDHSAIIGKMVPLDSIHTDDGIAFSLKKNGQLVQEGNTQDLLFSFDALIAYISQYFTLNVGDYIFTGTPEGVGPVQIGDRLEGFLGTQSLFDCQIK
jgi:2-keto-4-pentenoate hydratase/2-oxohepta-3-ene-1,7-dioic acid hydratase in catechol pathway